MPRLPVRVEFRGARCVAPIATLLLARTSNRYTTRRTTPDLAKEAPQTMQARLVGCKTTFAGARLIVASRDLTRVSIVAFRSGSGRTSRQKKSRKNAPLRRLRRRQDDPGVYSRRRRDVSARGATDAFRRRHQWHGVLSVCDAVSLVCLRRIGRHHRYEMPP